MDKKEWELIGELKIYPSGKMVATTSKGRKVWTFSEGQASALLNIEVPHEAGNKIIEFAERIKSDRAIVSMELIDMSKASA